MKISRCLAALLLCASTLVNASSIVVPGGLSIDLPEELDLTFQTIPDYDESELVIAGWSNDKLQYFMGFSRLPPGYANPQTYLVALARDLRTEWGGIEIGQQQQFRASSGFTVTAVVLSKPASAKNPNKTTLIAYHLTDGESSFLATLTAMRGVSVDICLEHATRILRSARKSQSTE